MIAWLWTHRLWSLCSLLDLFLLAPSADLSVQVLHHSKRRWIVCLPSHNILLQCYFCPLSYDTHE
jgi:hypothetical protein